MLMYQRLGLRLSQKPVLTQSLRQLVKLLALSKLDLEKEIAHELESNPVLETGVDLSDPVAGGTLEEQEIWESDDVNTGENVLAKLVQRSTLSQSVEPDGLDKLSDAESSDPFQEIDFNAFFNDYLDPGLRTPFAMEAIDRPSFETFLSRPTTLTDHLLWQLGLSLVEETVAATVEAIVGNLDEDGYLTVPLEEIAAATSVSEKQAEEALSLVQRFDPLGVGARSVGECLMIQLCAFGADEGVAGDIIEQHLDLLKEGRDTEIADRLGRPQRHIDTALRLIRGLDPRPGQNHAVFKTRTVEPDMSFVKTQTGFRVVLNEDDVPDLRLNGQYRHLLRKGKATKEVRRYVKVCYDSAIQLLRNIEQRRQTIEKVCAVIVHRQSSFLANGLEYLRPMKIKDVAEEIGVHPSTVSRAVANKFAHTSHGVYELRFFFSEAVRGPAGNLVPLLLLKRRVKKMVEQEIPTKPLTDNQISCILKEQGIEVTRRMVAKYRQSLNIPSIHRRRKRE